MNLNMLELSSFGLDRHSDAKNRPEAGGLVDYVDLDVGLGNGSSSNNNGCCSVGGCGIGGGGADANSDSGEGDTDASANGNSNSTLLAIQGRPPREQWARPIEFLLSCIAMSVGLGNLWRFPFTALKNGGGAFLIPYLIVLLTIGKPMYFLELAIGQFSSCGHIQIWKMAPFFKGVGYASAFATFCVISYYCSVMATTIFYFFASFQSRLPWTVCSEAWAGVKCGLNGTTAHILKNSNQNSNPLSNGSIFSLSSQRFTEASIPELYYKQEVLHYKENIDDGIGLPDWRLSLCLLAFWLIVFCCSVRGVKSQGKVAYFTAIFPYAVLFLLLIKGCSLPGAWDGVAYFFKPQWEKIFEANVWFAAIEQCFFSLSVGFGPVIIYASYNPFSHNVYRDAMILSFMDTFTSLLAGVTVFSILGYLAHSLRLPIDEVIQEDSALAFVSYPLVISTFEFAPQVYAALFFLMLLTLGVGSTISDSGSIVTVIHDQFPRIQKSTITAVVCMAGFTSGLLYVTPGGVWVLKLVDYFGVGLIIVFTATLEVVGIVFVYGLRNLIRDVEFMLKRKLGNYWKICWGFVVPAGLSIILFGTLWQAETPTNDDKEFPHSAIVCGWILCGVGLMIFPICAIHAVYTRKGKGIADKIRESFKPSLSWGPRETKLHHVWSQLPVPARYSLFNSNLLHRLSEIIPGTLSSRS